MSFLEKLFMQPFFFLDRDYSWLLCALIALITGLLTDILFAVGSDGVIWKVSFLQYNCIENGHYICQISHDCLFDFLKILLIKGPFVCATN